MQKNTKKTSKKSSSTDKNGFKKLKSNPDAKSFMKDDVKLFKLSPRNKKQELAIKSVKENAITFLIGAVGSGKTTLGCATAYELWQTGEYSQIVLLRPVTTSKTEELGFLKGDMNDKIEPLLLPLKSTFEKIMGKDVYASMIEFEIIVPFAINFIEGMTYERSIILLDEFQNIDDETLRSILTRITDNSKVIVMGDREQIKLKDPSLSCSHTTDRFKGKSNIAIVEFEEKDIVRGKITKIVESCYKDDLFAYNIDSKISNNKELNSKYNWSDYEWVNDGLNNEELNNG